MRFKLLASYLLVGIIPVIFLSNTIYSDLHNTFIEDRKIELKGQANMIAVEIATTESLYDKERGTELSNRVSSYSRRGDFRVLILDKSGVAIADSNKTDTGKTFLIKEVAEALDKKDNAVVKPGNIIYAVASILDNKDLSENEIESNMESFNLPYGKRAANTGEHDVLELNTTVEEKSIDVNVLNPDNEDTDVNGVVLIVASTKDINENIKELQGQAMILLIGLIVAVMVVVFFMSQIITDPIKNVSSVIADVADGHLDKRLIVKGHDEISQLSNSVNIMADRLEKVEKSRQNFVSNVSHELKTPLSSIKVLTEAILFEQDVPIEMYREFLEDINSEIDRMAAIIDDLLSLVKIDQASKVMNFEENNLNNIIHSVLKRLNPLARKKNIKITFEENKEVSMLVDEMKLSLAISNLIDNAIKYTADDGNIDIKIDSDHQNAFITIADNGIGIEEKELANVFERFYRVDETRDRDTGGTGLGLSLTHSIVLMHEGSIRVHSKLNEGSTFTIRLPLVKTNPVHKA